MAETNQTLDPTTDLQMDPTTDPSLDVVLGGGPKAPTAAAPRFDLYDSRFDAIDSEIVEVLESEGEDGADHYDVGAIANAVLTFDPEGDGWYSRLAAGEITQEHFREIVELNRL